MEMKFHRKPNVFIGEVHIKVQDLDRAAVYYQEVIGLRVLARTARSAVLTADDRTPLLTLEQPEGVTAKAGRTSGLYHFAILLPTRADLSVFLRHLLENNVRFGASDHHVSEALYLTDPDGNGIEVYRDRPSAEWRWGGDSVAMATEPLDGQDLLAESDAKWSGLPAGTIMGHIHLHVADLQAAERFYTQGLGFQTVAYYPQAAFMSTGGYHHHIAVNTWQGVGAPVPPASSVGLNWYSLVYADAAAREQAIERLRSLGAPVRQEAEYYATNDPSGNAIRLII